MTTDLTDSVNPDWYQPTAWSKQYPTRLSDHWRDPIWRDKWLCGMSDHQLSQLTTTEKSQALPSYCYVGVIELYGEFAQHHIVGYNFMKFAGVNIPSEHEIMKIGQALVYLNIKGHQQ